MWFSLEKDNYITEKFVGLLWALGAMIFYMGTQNGSKLVVWWQGLLIHASELKLWHFEVFQYVCIGKPYICNVFRPCATWVTFTRFVQNCCIGCLLALYGSSMHVAVGISSGRIPSFCSEKLSRVKRTAHFRGHRVYSRITVVYHGSHALSRHWPRQKDARIGEFHALHHSNSTGTLLNIPDSS